MKAPVGLLSDRTVLRSKMEGLCPDKFQFAEQRKSPCIQKRMQGLSLCLLQDVIHPCKRGCCIK